MNKYRNLFIWVLMAVMTILLINLLNTPKKAEEEMIFSEFIAKLDAGNVEEVVIKENYVMGRLNDGKKFKTYLAEYPDLVKELKAKGVKITAKPPEQNPWYVNFFFSWGPIIFLVLVWIFFMRQMQSGGNKALSFGKSKAKLVSDKA
ncbi:MAG: ATP-dependent metallopeptidase FtsH/Yme1/Tma family protein, partial [Nitrospirota bacterium]